MCRRLPRRSPIRNRVHLSLSGRPESVIHRHSQFRGNKDHKVGIVVAEVRNLRLLFVCILGGNLSANEVSQFLNRHLLVSITIKFFSEAIKCCLAEGTVLSSKGFNETSAAAQTVGL